MGNDHNGGKYKGGEKFPRVKHPANTHEQTEACARGGEGGEGELLEGRNVIVIPSVTDIEETREGGGGKERPHIININVCPSIGTQTFFHSGPCTTKPFYRATV
jgi:hypothetical protein